MWGAEERQKIALIEYLEENQERFYRIAFSYVKNRETAMDLVQDAIVKAFLNFSSLKKKEYVRTWFYRILVNECLMYLRKNRLLFLQDFEEQIELPHSDKNFEAIELYEAIEQLNPDLKTVVILRFFEDLKFEEIAKITKTNINTVKSRLYKALKLLRVSIEEANVDE